MSNLSVEANASPGFVPAFWIISFGALCIWANFFRHGSRALFCRCDDVVLSCRCSFPSPSDKILSPVTKLLEGGRKKFVLGRAAPPAAGAAGAGGAGSAAPGASGATASAMARRAIFLSASKAKATAPRIVEAPGAVTSHHEEPHSHDGASAGSASAAAAGSSSGLDTGVRALDLSAGSPQAGSSASSVAPAGSAAGASVSAPYVSVPIAASKPAFAPFPSTVSLSDSPSGAPADADAALASGGEEGGAHAADAADALAAIKTPKKSLEAAFAAVPERDVENAVVAVATGKAAFGPAGSSAVAGMKPVLSLGTASAASTIVRREPLSPATRANGRR